MTVKELINALEDFDQELEIKRYCESLQFSVEYYNLNVVNEEYNDNKKVLLIG